MSKVKLSSENVGVAKLSQSFGPKKSERSKTIDMRTKLLVPSVHDLCADIDVLALEDKQDNSQNTELSEDDSEDFDDRLDSPMLSIQNSERLS